MASSRGALELYGSFRKGYGSHKPLSAERREFSRATKTKIHKKIVSSTKTMVWHNVHVYKVQFTKDPACWLDSSHQGLATSDRNFATGDRKESKYQLSMETKLLRQVPAGLLPKLLKGLLQNTVTPRWQALASLTTLPPVALGSSFKKENKGCAKK